MIQGPHGRYPHGPQGTRSSLRHQAPRDYKLADGGGLYLLVRPNGSKLWRLKYRFAGKEKLLALGRYPELGLADARLRRAEAKVALGQEVDPGAKAPLPPAY